MLLGAKADKSGISKLQTVQDLCVNLVVHRDLSFTAYVTR